MSCGRQKEKVCLREASIDDITVMSGHHGKMFAEIWERKGEHLAASRIAEIELAYAKKLETEMAGGICRAWVIEDHGKIVASGAITLISLAPNPLDLSCRVAYLHSMYTEKPHRNRKHAQRIVSHITDDCKSKGIMRILLNASDEGKPVYEKIGFCSAPDTMRLFVG